MYDIKILLNGTVIAYLKESAEDLDDALDICDGYVTDPNAEYQGYSRSMFAKIITIRYTTND